MSVSTSSKPISLNAPRPDPPSTKNQKIARVVRIRASNLFEVKTPDKSILLMLIPNRFRRQICVNLGDFVVVEHVEKCNKVKVEMVKLLTFEEIWVYKMNNAWPKEFSICLDLWRRNGASLFLNQNIKQRNITMNSCSFIDSDSSSGSEDDGDDSSTFTEAHGSEYSSDSGGDCTDKET